MASVSAQREVEFKKKQLDIFKKRKIDDFVKEMNIKLRSELKRAHHEEAKKARITNEKKVKRLVLADIEKKRMKAERVRYFEKLQIEK